MVCGDPGCGISVTRKKAVEGKKMSATYLLPPSCSSVAKPNLQIRNCVYIVFPLLHHLATKVRNLHLRI